MSEFVHLHVHSEYSLLDGANRIKDLPVVAKKLGMDSIAITDHGVMFGVIDFYKACKSHGVKPIIGCEVYVAPRTRHDKEANIDNKYHHLILLAKNEVGYKNLLKLVSLGFVEGYYYKPRVDKEILEKYKEGLICCSACLGGEVASNITNGNAQQAEQIALWYKSIFGKDYYLEIQSNTIPEQIKVNQKIVEMSKKLDIPLVATNDAHYRYKEDAYNHEILLCVQTGKKITDEDRMRFPTDDFYIKSPEEMKAYFKNIPEALENTVKIANQCNVEFEFGNTILPDYDVPKEYETHFDYMKKICDDGLKLRYGNDLPKEVVDRAEYELSVINKMGYVEYFLIVWDYINWARSKEISVGPGRGSGAGSIIAYAMQITDVDPMRYNLLFERFLNPERISMPDFDIDFCYERRQEVLDYVSEKYGVDHVSQIITFGTMSARMVIRDVGRALDVSYAETDKLAKMIPNELNITIKKALEQNSELRQIYETNSTIKRLLEIAMFLEGLPRQASTHACGVVITKEPVDNYVPLYIKENTISTQFVMTTLEELGLLKMDFLGLRTLTVIQDTIELVKKTKGIDIVFDKDMNDSNVYKLWQNGDSVGIFQFESQGMTSFMKELKPDCFEDIVAGVSLYRPGPMDQIPRYIKNKQNPENAEYTHNSLKPILEVTYGCMVYQEQVMQIVRDLAGYSLGRADLVRRAMGKKKLDVMEKERQCFIYGQTDEDGKIIIPGCVRNGIDEKSANKIFDEMAEFAKYAFNKSHAAAYAVISYQTAYLKTYYTPEFMAATLNSFLGNLDKIPDYIDDCKRRKIDILKPDINKSYTKFTVDNGKIRFGLGSIKNVGTGVIDTIVLERENNGSFLSFADFCERMQNKSVNKRCIESLIKSGAFDEFKHTRSTLIASFETIIDNISDEARKNIKGQVSMFDLGGKSSDENMQKIKYSYNTLKEYSERELLLMEKEMLGIYISGHPLEGISEQIKKQTNINTLQIRKLDNKHVGNLETQELTNSQETLGTKNGRKQASFKDGQNIKYAGIINSIKKKFTKTNKLMAFATVEDLYGQCEVIIFENCYQKSSDILLNEAIVLIEGRLSIREDEQTKIIASNISKFNVELEDFKRRAQTEINGKTLEIDVTNLNEEQKSKLRGAIRFYSRSKNNILLTIINGEKNSPAGGIFITDEIFKKLQEITGNENIKIYN